MLTGQSESLKECMCENARVTLFLSYTLIANFSNSKLLPLSKARCSVPESHVHMTHHMRMKNTTRKPLLNMLRLCPFANN